MDILLEQRRANRFRLLRAVYDAANASTSFWCDARKLTAHDARVTADLGAAFSWLKSAGLLKQHGAGYKCLLTHEGINAVEAALISPSEPTRFFPAVDEIEFSGSVPKV